MSEEMTPGETRTRRARRRDARSNGGPPDSAPVDRILEAAESCFRDTGYASVTLREIAERAGVSKSLVLYHFASKDHVFAELQLRIYRRLAKTVKDAVASSDAPPAERAAVALDALTSAVRQRNDLAVHAMLGARALATPAAAPHVRRMRRELRELLRRTMQELFGHEQDRLPLSVDAAGDLLWAALTGLGLQAVLDDSPEELERGFESLRTIVKLAFSATETRVGGHP